jgi:hypothetical protein
MNKNGATVTSGKIALSIVFSSYAVMRMEHMKNAGVSIILKQCRVSKHEHNACDAQVNVCGIIQNPCNRVLCEHNDKDFQKFRIKMVTEHAHIMAFCTKFH